MGPRDGLNDSKKQKSLSLAANQYQTFHLSSPSHYFCVLIVVQRDATQSSLFVILQVRSTCFGCQPHPSSGVLKTVTTASGTGHIFLCSYF